VTKVDYIVGVVGFSSSLAAAFLWLYASVQEVPDNIDRFIGELNRISRLNAYAAVAAAVAALCVCVCEASSVALVTGDMVRPEEQRRALGDVSNRLAEKSPGWGTDRGGS
jgi:hypothetical protein